MNIGVSWGRVFTCSVVVTQAWNPRRYFSFRAERVRKLCRKTLRSAGASAVNGSAPEAGSGKIPAPPKVVFSV